MSPPPNERQRGAAVVAALLVVALVSATMATLLTDLDAWIDDVDSARDKAQATEQARNAVAYARALLAADAAGSAIDTLDEDWARELPPLRHEGARIGGRIVDLQGRFNLNNLRREDGRLDLQAFAAYRRLLAILGLPDKLANALAEHLTGSVDGAADGAPASGRPLLAVGELQGLAGYDAGVLARLAGQVCVLAGSQPVNVNTAPAAVLSALQPGLSPAAAASLASGRRGLPFRDSGDFRNRLGDPGLPGSLLPIAAASRHFLIEIEVDRDRARSRVASLVRRNANGRLPEIVWQTLL
jgi:general secretion pathway protein K